MIGPTTYAAYLKQAREAYQSGNEDPRLVAIAKFCSLDPDTLAIHVEGMHGWSDHYEGYEEAVWKGAACLLKIRPCPLLVEV